MYVFATVNTSVQDSVGNLITIRENEAYDSEHPIVKLRPELFSKDPTRIIGTESRALPVEQATRAPGERRELRRG